MKTVARPITARSEFDAALAERIAVVEASFRPDLELRPRDYLLVTAVAGVLPVLAVIAGFAGWFA